MKKLLIISQIGSPDAPEAQSVGRYLKKFLMDPRIIQAPFFIRWILVNILIVPRRKKASAEKYHNIWTEKGSPLVLETEKFAKKLEIKLNQNYTHDEWVVCTHWRYGEETEVQLEKIKNDFKDFTFSEVYLAPMYPQYAEATMLSALDVLTPVCRKIWSQAQLLVLKPFYDEPEFINAWADKIRTRLGVFDQILFSFHGLPEAQVLKIQGCKLDSECCKRADISCCYPAQCQRTVQKIVDQLGLSADQYSLSYQSRVGPTKWLGPATDLKVQELVQKNGVRSLLVVCPAFVTDGLETLEEINMELRGHFKALGGAYFEMSPSLNDDSQWVSGFHSIMQRENSWREA